ncbi:hypothetical protein BGX28_003748 [Mortierella sp. GBA30]|nr:hypothetical protein BGX28_003748 [Mortierella sp. GBA30]
MVDVHNPRSPARAEVDNSTGISFYQRKGIMKVFGIPEIHAFVCGLLSINAFINCALACRELHALFTPYVWGAVAINTAAQEMCFITKAATTALNRYRMFVRSFQTYKVKDLELHVEVSIRANAHDDGQISVPPPNSGQHAKQASLRRLTLHGSILSTPENAQRRIYQRCGELNSLELTDKLGGIDAVSTGAMFRLLCPKLEHLEIETSVSGLTDESIEGLISPPVARSAVEPAATAAPTVMITPPLTPAYLSPLDSATPSIAESLSATASSLTQLASSSFWSSIAINAPGFGPLSSAAIVRHASTLEDITLVDRGLEVEDLLQLLSTAPRLKRLVSLSKRGPQYNVTFPKPAMTASLVPWGCADTLEEFHVSLRPGYCDARSRDALLSQIATLTHLRVLHLHNGVQRKMGFSDFSLDSRKGGLRRLGGLKDLEVFELRYFKHGIGQEERDWMAEQWPKLKRVCTECDYGHHSSAKRRRTRD